ncbi:hypothetical protein ACHAXS_001698, partial [Conticribra weissflogii]
MKHKLVAIKSVYSLIAYKNILFLSWFYQKLRRSPSDTPNESTTNIEPHVAIRQGRDTADTDFRGLSFPLTAFQNQTQPSNPPQLRFNSSLISNHGAPSGQSTSMSANSAHYFGSLQQNDLDKVKEASEFATKACNLLRIFDVQTRLKLAKLYMDNTTSSQTEDAATLPVASSSNSPNRASHWFRTMMENATSRQALVSRIGIEQQQLKKDQTRGDAPQTQKFMSSFMSNVLLDNRNRQEEYFGLDSADPSSNLLFPANQQQQQQQQQQLSEILSSLVAKTSIRR